MKNKDDLSKCLRWGVVATTVYLVCIVLFFYPYFGNFDSALIGPPEDNMQDFWNTWYSQNMLETDPSAFFSTRLLFFPDQTSLIYHSFSYPNLIFIFILRKIFQLPPTHSVLIALHNGMLLLSFYLAALGAYLLIRKFTKDDLTALIGGFIFGFSPFHLAHALHHITVATIQFIPFFVLSFLKFIESRKGLPFVGTVLFYLLSALSCWYYLFYLAYFIVFYYLFHAIGRRQPIIKELIKPMVSVFVAVLILLSPLLIPMVAEGIHNKRVNAGGHNVFVADLLGFVVFHPYHLLGDLTRPIHSRFTGNAWELTVYLGMVNIGLLLWVYFKKQTRQIENLPFCLWGMFFFMLFAAGAFLHILGKSTYIPLPSGLTQFLPLIRNVRTPSRAIVFVYLFLGIAISLILSKTFLTSKNKGRAPVFWFITLLIFVDFYPTHRESTQVTCPPAYRILQEDPEKDFGIIDLPKGYIEGNHYMMYQTFHQRPIVNASISRSLKKTLSEELNGADLDYEKDQLTRNRVKYVIIHKQLNQKSGYRIPIGKYQEYYQTLYFDEESVVLRVY